MCGAKHTNERVGLKSCCIDKIELDYEYPDHVLVIHSRVGDFHSIDRHASIRSIAVLFSEKYNATSTCTRGTVPSELVPS